jgi:hypothetical protein
MFVHIVGNCCVDGKEHQFGQAVLYFPGKTNDCQELFCIFGHLVKVDNYLCLHHQEKTFSQKKTDFQNLAKRQYSTTTFPPTWLTTTTTFYTTANVGCHYNGKWYMPGETIEHGKSGHWCYFTHCSYDSQVIQGDNFHCGETTTVPTTKPTYMYSTTTNRYPTTSEFYTTANAGCYYHGKWYMPGETIVNGRSGHWCYSTHCSYDSQVIHGDNFRCGETTTISTTIPPYSTTTIPYTTTTELIITPMYCFFNDPSSGKMTVWRGGTTAKLSDGTVCRCEYWGRLSCPENNVGK